MIIYIMAMFNTQYTCMYVCMYVCINLKIISDENINYKVYFLVSNSSAVITDYCYIDN